MKFIVIVKKFLSIIAILNYFCLPIIETDYLCPFLTSTPDIKPDDFISQYLELVSWSQPLHRLILFFELVVSVVNLQLVDVGGATEYMHITLPGQYKVLFPLFFQMSKLCLLTGLGAALLTGGRGGWSKLTRLCIITMQLCSQERRGELFNQINRKVARHL